MTDTSREINNLMQLNEHHKMAWMRAEERIANMENMFASAMNAVEHACLKLKEQGEARRADERQLAELCTERNDLAAQIEEARKENERLLAVAQKEPHTAYLEAVQRACDERMVALKHAEREVTARAEEAERQLAEMHEKVGALIEDKAVLTECNEAVERQLAEAREALRDAARQIRYLHDRFAQTDTGNATLARIDAAIQDRAPVKGKPCPNCRGTGECDFGSEFASSVCPSCAGSGVCPC